MMLSRPKESSMWLMYSAIAARMRTVLPLFSGEYIHVSPHTCGRACGRLFTKLSVTADRLDYLDNVVR